MHICNTENPPEVKCGLASELQFTEKKIRFPHNTFQRSIQLQFWEVKQKDVSRLLTSDSPISSCDILDKYSNYPIVLITEIENCRNGIDTEPPWPFPTMFLSLIFPQNLARIFISNRRINSLKSWYTNQNPLPIISDQATMLKAEPFS